MNHKLIEEQNRMDTTGRPTYLSGLIVFQYSNLES
jgi:hypothetical protein